MRYNINMDFTEWLSWKNTQKMWKKCIKKSVIHFSSCLLISFCLFIFLFQVYRCMCVSMQHRKLVCCILYKCVSVCVPELFVPGIIIIIIIITWGREQQCSYKICCQTNERCLLFSVCKDKYGNVWSTCGEVFSKVFHSWKRKVLWELEGRKHTIAVMIS